MGFSETEAFEVMASAMAERGIVTQEQISGDRAALNARLNGEPAVEPQSQPQPLVKADKAGDSTSTAGVLAPAPGSAQQSQDPLEQISQDVFEAPDSPAAYRFDRLPHGVTHDFQQEQAIRSVFHEFGVPAPIAAQVDRMYSQSILNPPDAQSMELERQKTHIQIERTYPGESAKVVEIAQREFRAMAAKEPRLVEMVERSGLGNSFYLVSSLYQMARAKGRA